MGQGDGGAPGAASPARVVIHTRAGCHLCDVARGVVASVCAVTGDRWAEVDIDGPGGDGGVRERWTDLVPVVTVDGRHHDHWRIDADRLRSSLTTVGDRHRPPGD